MTTAFDQHLQSGSTTVCRAWVITRADGVVLGFTDHDRDLHLGATLCRADSGLTARALQLTTGLAVDNSEAVGALSSRSINEADLIAGRYDGAEVRVWLVNWAMPDERQELFRGSLGEVARTGAAFRVELRGQSEPLNQPTGFAYTRTCSAVLGDTRCRFDLTQPGYFLNTVVQKVDADRRLFLFADLAGYDLRWFETGRFVVRSGAASGLTGVVKSDREHAEGRAIELWQAIRAEIAIGDAITLTAGCDKRASTCRTKFANFLNFRGFPQMPGDDWLAAVPRSGQSNRGGSLVGGTGAIGD